MLFTDHTLNDFEEITGVQIGVIFTSFDYFVKEKSKNIVDYYSGKLNKPDGESFSLLDRLINDLKNCIDLFHENQNNLGRYDYWELLDLIEKMYLKLLVISNISKFLRSSLCKGNFNPNPERDVTLGQGQTLEFISSNIVNSQDGNNDWVGIANYNDLIEEDYTPSGGNLLKVVFPRNTFVSTINSVIDNINGENVYGIDIYRKLTFESNDLKTLSYKDTILQQTNIILNLKKGDNPEFPNDGISQNPIGSDIYSLSFPSIFRQLLNVFMKDDRYNSISLRNIESKQDAIFLEMDIKTVYGLSIEENLKI